MNPVPIRRKDKAETERAVAELIAWGFELITPITEVKTALSRSVAIVYFAKLRKVD